MGTHASLFRAVAVSVAAQTLGACALAIAILLMGAAGTARAASETTNCAGLQAALNQAVNGDTITLNQLCTKNNSGGANGQFNLSPTASQSYTLVGQTGSGAGFDGTGVAQRVLTAGNASAPTTLTLRNLLVENSTMAGNGGGLFFDGQYSAVLDGDTFTNDHATSGVGGAVEIFSLTPSGSLTITNSTFSGNSATVSGGALDINYNPPIATTLTNNVFASNSVTGASGNNLAGGALNLLNNYGSDAPVTQTGNVFNGNGVAASTISANGGGEAIVGMTLTSTNDRFTGNTLQAPASGQVSEGAGLSIESNSCNVSPPQQTANNLVIAGNSIADGGPAGGEHGALYLGCAPGGSNQLTLNDATISGNRGGGDTGGIWGDPSDHLTLNNTVLSGDSDGAELTGFGTGVTTVNYSDLCAGSAPFTGTGNICAPPLLANAPGGDIHETAASPTIDAGSNGLVPTGLTTDFEGAARIQPRTSGGTPLVDIGADEFDTAALAAPNIPAPAPPAPPKPPFNDFTLSGAGNAQNGDIDLTFQIAAGGSVDVLGTHSAPGTMASALLLPGHQRIEWGRLDSTYKYGATFGLTLHPNALGKHLFQRHRRFGLPLRVRVWMTFSPTGGTPRTHMITVRVLRAHHATRHGAKHHH